MFTARYELSLETYFILTLVFKKLNAIYSNKSKTRWRRPLSKCVLKPLRPNKPESINPFFLCFQTSAKLDQVINLSYYLVNPLNAELNPICYLLALLGAHHFLHVSRIRVESLTLRQLMSYKYMEHLFLMFLDHTQWRSTVGRTPLDEWSARRRDLYLTTHDTHNRQISMPPGGIRTHDLSRRAAADLRLRPRGHWDRQFSIHC